MIEPGQAYALPNGAVVLVTGANPTQAGEWLVVDLVNVLPVHMQGDVKTYHADELGRATPVRVAIATVSEGRI